MLLVSHDSKYLFSVNGSRLNVYSILSGELVYRLSYTNQQDDSLGNYELLIKSICINPQNKYQLFSFHLNGFICLWDYEDGLLIKAFESKLNLKKVIRVKNSIYAVGESKKKSNNSKHKGVNGLTNGVDNDDENNKNNLSLYKLLIDEAKNNNTVEHELILSNLTLNQDKLLIAIDYNEKYVAYVEGRKKLVINQFKSNSSMKKFNAKMELTCITMHPNEDCIATGSINGKIIIWYNYLASVTQSMSIDEDDSKLNRKKKSIEPTMNILHWHSLPVLSLSFTTEGSFLLSGGHECVMVKWLFKTGQKDFKPRLGSPINELASSADNNLYVTGHLDNTIHLIGSNLKVTQTLSGFLCPNFSTTKEDLINSPDHTFYQTGLSYFKQLNCLVTNGRPGHLQFYSYTTDKLLFNLDIVNENYISPENLNRPNYHTEIEGLVFNHDASWLVTVERRNDFETTPDVKLKFWFYDQTNKKFILNTLVKYPHSFDKVTKLKFKPNENILFTCGQDGCFKSWTLNKNKPTTTSDPNELSFNWSFNSCNGYRDMSPNDIEFLSVNNKEMLAVSFNHIVTLWSCEYNISNLFLDDLIHCDQTDHIKYLKKIDDMNLLVVHGNCLNLWNFKSNSNQVDLLDSTNDNIVSNCIWNTQVEDVLSVERSPVNESELFIIEREQEKLDSLDSQTKIKISNIQFKKSSSNFDIKLNKFYEFKIFSKGYIHFLIIPNVNKNQDKNEEINIDEIDIFYTDNRGVVKKLRTTMNEGNKNQLKTADNLDSELTESMWQNRKLLAKNLPESNLAKIIETNKSNKLLNKLDQFIDENRNDLLEDNLKRIESTPAYLIPKVGTFCLETLKSMLFKLDEKKYEIENSV